MLRGSEEASKEVHAAAMNFILIINLFKHILTYILKNNNSAV